MATLTYASVNIRKASVWFCSIKWALGSITMNKASGGDGIPVDLFYEFEQAPGVGDGPGSLTC